MLSMSVNIGRFGAKIAVSGASAAAASASTVIVATGVGVGVALVGYGTYRYLCARREARAPMVLNAGPARGILPARD